MIIFYPICIIKFVLFSKHFLDHHSCSWDSLWRSYLFCITLTILTYIYLSTCISMSPIVILSIKRALIFHFNSFIIKWKQHLFLVIIPETNWGANNQLPSVTATLGSWYFRCHFCRWRESCLYIVCILNQFCLYVISLSVEDS